jgi:hypothetical protein
MKDYKVKLRKLRASHTLGWLFHFRHTVFSVTLKEKVDNTLTKTETLCITLSIDGVSITSKTHTHPSHSQTSRLLNSSLSLDVPTPTLIHRSCLYLSIC